MLAAVENPVNIKKERRYLKSLYFILFLAFGSIQPFVGAFYRQVLTTEDGSPDMLLIGIIATCSPIVAFFANLSVGVLCDKFGLSQKLVTILAFMGAFFAITLGILGAHTSVEIPSFAILFIIAILSYSFVVASLGPLVDSETLHHLNKHSDRKKFGILRIWGTYGWAISALSVGILLTFIGCFGKESGNVILAFVSLGKEFLAPTITNFQYQIIYFVGAAMMLFLAIFGIKARPVIEKKPKISYKHLFKDFLFMRFLIFVFIQGIIMAATTEHYFSFFWAEILSGPLQIGMVYAFWTIPEIFIMKNSDKLLHRFGSRKILLAGISFIALQLLLLSTLTPEMPFILKFMPAMLHGVSFALHFIGTINYLDSYAPQNMKATYLTTMYIARSVFAAVIGGALGATVIHNFGTAMLMRGGAVCMVLMALFFVLFVKLPKEVAR